MYKNFFVISSIIISTTTSTLASQANASFDPVYRYTKICHDSACASYGILNFSPSTASAAIVNNVFTGYLWGNEIGWVNLQPTGSGVSVNPTTGVVTWLGFSSVAGFINFSPTNGGVTISGNGELTGHAWSGGLYGGWIPFDCSATSTCVKTEWRPSSGGSGGIAQGASYFVCDGVPCDPQKMPSTSPKKEMVDDIKKVKNEESRPVESSSGTVSISSATPLRELPLLSRPLAQRARSPEVGVLQVFLASDKSIYPEANVTGFYGPATKRAVQRFQIKYKITTPSNPYYGIAGPKTIAEINRQIREVKKNQNMRN